MAVIYQAELRLSSKGASMSMWKAIQFIMTLHCEEASFLISRQQDEPLLWWERMAVSLHAMICHNCHMFRRQLGWIRQLTRRRAEELAAEPVGPQDSLSTGSKERLQQAVLEGLRSSGSA